MIQYELVSGKLLIRAAETMEIDPWSSKLGSMLAKGARLNLDPRDQILYLGAGAGTTLSYLAKLVPRGMIYAIEISYQPFRRLVEICSKIPNAIPILGDASNPQEYSFMVGKVDLIYQDIAQRNQVEIALKNSEFLRSKGRLILQLKTPSISALPKAQILEMAKSKLESRFELDQVIDLEPYHKAHYSILGRLR